MEGGAIQWSARFKLNFNYSTPPSCFRANSSWGSYVPTYVNENSFLFCWRKNTGSKSFVAFLSSYGEKQRRNTGENIVYIYIYISRVGKPGLEGNAGRINADRAWVTRAPKGLLLVRFSLSLRLSTFLFISKSNGEREEAET